MSAESLNDNQSHLGFKFPNEDEVINKRAHLASEAVGRVGISFQDWKRASNSLKRFTDSSTLNQLLHPFQRHRLQEKLWTANRRMDSSLSALRLYAAGSEPRRWTVFSGSPGFTLEGSLEELVFNCETYQLYPAILSDASRLLKSMPLERLASARGDTSAEERVSSVLLKISRALAERDCNHKHDTPENGCRFYHLLQEHLDGHKRLLPQSLDHLNRRPEYGFLCSTPVCLQAYPDVVPSFYRRGYGGPIIKLHNISVDQEFSGMGLGTAVLAHLCRTADNFRLAIEALFAPQLPPGLSNIDDKYPAYRYRIAKWYASFGFFALTSDQRGTIHDPHEWFDRPQDGSSLRTIRREPLC